MKRGKDGQEHEEDEGNVPCRYDGLLAPIQNGVDQPISLRGREVEDDGENGVYYAVQHRRPCLRKLVLSGH